MEEELSTSSTSSDDEPVAWTICNAIVSTLNFGASLMCMFVFCSIMLNREMRRNAFNLYVSFMIFPDSLYTMGNGFLYLSKALGVPLFPPYEVIVYIYFVNFVVNFYANGVVTHEINKLIEQSNKRQRTKDPDLSRVYKQMAAVYFYGSFLGIWAIIPANWSLFHITNNAKGEGDLGSPPGGVLNRTAAIGIAYGTVLIPTVYVVYVSIKIWRRKLLPRKGKTRTLSLFFMRVIIVFVLFYFPNTATTVIQSKMDTASGIFWIRILRGLLGAGQVYTTLYLITHKDDIRLAVIKAYNDTFGKLCCKYNNSTNRNGRNGGRGSVRVSGISLELTSERPVSTYQTPENSTSGNNKNNVVVMQKKSEWEAEDEYENDVIMESEWMEEGSGTGKTLPAAVEERNNCNNNNNNDIAAEGGATRNNNDDDEERGGQTTTATTTPFNSVNMAGQISNSSTS